MHHAQLDPPPKARCHPHHFGSHTHNNATHMHSCHFWGAVLTPMLRCSILSSPLRVYSSVSCSTAVHVAVQRYVRQYGSHQGWIMRHA